VTEAEVSTEGIIRVMPEVLANKIAAGEVVGRPASVVKELVENALDAGARSVEVLLVAAGRSLIQVVDDGAGMHPDDARRCFSRHATSKVRAIEDLDHIQTLGFRGEALASISAVARVELRTRRPGDESGTRVVVEGGEEVVCEPVGAPGGTSVAVRQLFYNVPARRAFLKTDATELGHVIRAVQVLALANPAVGFRVEHDGTELVRLEASPGDREEGVALRVEDLYDHSPGEDLLPVSERTSYLSVRGWIGRPGTRRRSRGEQFLFVNGRAVRSRYLEHAVFNAYRGLVPEGTYPFFVLFLDVDSRHVDVNVHPTKAEVKFDDERGIYGMLRATVGRSLSHGTGALQMNAAPLDLLGSRHTDTAQYAGASYSSPKPGPEPGRTSDLLYNTAGLVAREPDPEEAEPDPDPERMLWQLQGSYIVTPIRSGLLVVDQRVAHERVVYERALRAMEDGFGLSQQLLFPKTVDLPPAEHALLEDLMPHLRSLGFDVSALSGRSVMVRGVPADIRTGDEQAALSDLLDQYRSFAERLRLPARELLARSMARRGAVQGGSRLEPAEMRALIDQLFQCSEPYVGPGGKPTLVRITADELARRFGDL
jgi:DNA mismatch repair protein MutL